MYTPSRFEMSQQECFQMILKHSFGQILVVDNNEIQQSFLPFEINQSENCLYTHIAKKNDLLINFNDKTNAYVNFIGHNAYISPNWYDSNEQVPTWNYQAVEIKGKLTLLNEEGTLDVITRLSRIHEEQFEYPWTIDKLPERKTTAMVKAIIGIKIDIIKISGQSKMSQNKSIDEQKNLVNGLESMTEQSDKNVAKIMRHNMGNDK